MIINTNISSLITRNNLRQNNNELQAAMEKLSSGKRVNGAMDDAAGLSIITRMTTQVRGMEVAGRNANDGISLLQTAESAMGSISDVLQRVRELAVQADNGTYSATDRTSLQMEITALIAEAEHIAQSTNFNGIQLLNGATTTITLHISDLATDTMTFGLSNVTSGAAGLNIDAIDVTAVGGAQNAITTVDTALNVLSSNRSTLGAMQNRLQFTIDNLSVATQNTTSSRSRIEDADMAEESSKLTRSEILNSSAIAMLSKANQNPQQIMQLLQGQ